MDKKNYYLFKAYISARRFFIGPRKPLPPLAIRDRYEHPDGMLKTIYLFDIAYKFYPFGPCRHRPRPLFFRVDKQQPIRY
jgi:hypothetical protein